MQGAARVLERLIKRAQEQSEPARNDDRYQYGNGYVGSQLLPPASPLPMAPPVQPPTQPKVAVPPGTQVPPAHGGVAPPAKKYIPYPPPGRQTAKDIAEWQALIKAQGGQGVAPSAGSAGFGLKP